MKKTKKALLAVAACAAVFTGAFGLAACDGLSGNKACEHDWSAWTVEEANKPTAAAGGKATRTCPKDGCDAADSDKEYALPALDSEDYTKSADTATCAAGGTVTYTYNKNGVNVSFTVNTPQKTEHTWGPWTVEEANKPTAEDGKATRTCTVDGCTVAADEYALPALDSEDYEKTPDTATCVAGGTVTYTYNKNGVNVSFTANTPQKTEHTWGPWTVEEANKPTEGAGGKATRTCTVDGCHVEAQEHILPALNKTDYTLTGDTAKCMSGGTATYSYNKDGVSVSFTAETSANPDVHGTLEHNEAVAQTCDKDGNVEYWECPLCRKKFDAAENGNDIENVVIPANGHNYGEIVVGANGKATETCTIAGCGHVKTYTFIDDSNAGSSDNLTPISSGDYYIEKATNGYLWLKLDLTEAAIYKIDFEHLTDSGVGAITLLRVDGTNSTATNVISGRSGAVATGFANIATHEHVVGNNNQSASFTFDSTNYTGRFLQIQLSVQKQPKIKMTVSKDKVPLKVGNNMVNITEEGATADSSVDKYEFTSATDKDYSITVPDGVMVLLNGEDLITSGTSANFTAEAGVSMVFTFLGSTVGGYTVTIGEPIVVPKLSPDSSMSQYNLTGHAASVIEVGDIEAGKYTVTLTITNMLMRSYICFGVNVSENYSDYFQPNGNTVSNSPADVSFNAAGMNAIVHNSEKIESATLIRTTWTVTLNLKKGDKLVFVNSGNDGGISSITMAAAE